MQIELLAVLLDDCVLSVLVVVLTFTSTFLGPNLNKDLNSTCVSDHNACKQVELENCFHDHERYDAKRNRIAIGAKNISSCCLFVPLYRVYCETTGNIFKKFDTVITDN